MKNFLCTIFLFSIAKRSTCYPISNNFGEKQAASSYFYQTAHGPKSSFFITGKGSVFPPRKFNSRYNSYLTTPLDTTQGAHSYVVQHAISNNEEKVTPFLDSTLPSLVPNLPFEQLRTSNEHSQEDLESKVDISDALNTNSDSHEITPNSFHIVYHDDHDHGAKYSDGKGSKYGSDFHKKQGSNKEKSYDKEHKESSGDKGHYDNKDSSGFAVEGGGKKKQHYDEKHDYSKKHEQEYAKSGGKHGEKKYHKKGSKTTGYHNVYHKDEYKKDHTFYDEADHQGHFSKHGEAEKHHFDKEGEEAKQGHHDSVHKEGSYKKHENDSKGHFDEEHKKFKNEKGFEKEHDDNEKYASKHGSGHNHEHSGVFDHR